MTRSRPTSRPPNDFAASTFADFDAEGTGNLLIYRGFGSEIRMTKSRREPMRSLGTAALANAENLARHLILRLPAVAA